MIELEAKACLDNIMRFYAEMKPFVGDRYDNTGQNGLMLVGESHYLPKDTKCDRTPQAWYQGDSILDYEDRAWISTADIIKEESIGGFPNRTHSIWRLSAVEIIHALTRSDNLSCDSIKEMYGHVAVFNFFVRPSKKGESIGPELEAIDIDVAKLRFANLIEELKPRAVIVLSALAGRYVDVESLRKKGIDCLITPHPGCSWWNRPSRKYGGKSGRELVAAFMKNLELKWR